MRKPVDLRVWATRTLLDYYERPTVAHISPEAVARELRFRGIKVQPKEKKK